MNIIDLNTKRINKLHSEISRRRNIKDTYGISSLDFDLELRALQGQYERAIDLERDLDHHCTLSDLAGYTKDTYEDAPKNVPEIFKDLEGSHSPSNSEGVKTPHVHNPDDPLAPNLLTIWILASSIFGTLVFVYMVLEFIINLFI